MYLIVDQMMQFKVVHISDGYGAVKLLARSSVDKLRFAVACPRQLSKIYARAALAEKLLALAASLVIQRTDILLVSAVKYGRSNFPAKCFRDIAEVNFKHLTDVHT